MSREEFTPLFEAHVGEAFAEDHSYALADLLQGKEREKMSALQNRLGDLYELRLGAFDQTGRFVGWSWSRQETRATLYMFNAAVLPEYRRRGVYGQLVQTVLETAEAEGFQMIYSRHCATNNAVIVPKLKAGFVISKLELSDTYGVLVHLHYYPNETRRKVVDYRSGLTSPDGELKRLFKLL